MWRNQFFTALDIVCSKHRCRWTVKGEYIRHLITNQDSTHSSMTVCLNAHYHDRFNGVMTDMERLQYIKEDTRKEVNPNTIVYHSTNAQFAVVFTLQDESINCFDIDTIILTKHGITVENRSNIRGISLTECLARMSKKRVKRLFTYGNCHMMNGEILINEGMLIREGFTVTNQPLFSNKEHMRNDCPICFESLQHVPYTTIGCGHSLCMNCLGLHMAKKEEMHSKCPMCRTKIFLLT